MFAVGELMESSGGPQRWALELKSFLSVNIAVTLDGWKQRCVRAAFEVYCSDFLGTKVLRSCFRPRGLPSPDLALTSDPPSLIALIFMVSLMSSLLLNRCIGSVFVGPPPPSPSS